MDRRSLTVVIGRDEIEARDTSRLEHVFRQLLAPEAAVKYCERVELAVVGYEEDPRVLHEIPEVRDFIHMLDEEFPYWCYFLTKHGMGLLLVLACFCPTDLPVDGRPYVAEAIGTYLMERGLPAMIEICESVGCSEPEKRHLADQVMDYFSNGPQIDET